MTLNPRRRSLLLSVSLLALAFPAATSFAQTKSATPTSTPGTVTPQTVTGGDPKPVWPSSLKMRSGIE